MLVTKISHVRFLVFTALSAALGAVLSIILGIINRCFFDYMRLHPYNGFDPTFSKLENLLQKFTLVFWPSSIFGLADPVGRNYVLYAYELTANVLLYIFVGAFVWLGIKKHKAFFIFPILLLTVIWKFLLWR